MINDLGCEFSIIGHSERRILFDETSQIIRQKLIQANNNSVIPILCIGESAEENQANNTFNVLEKQIIEALQDIAELSSLIIAYEPVWAIGSGKIPNPEEINSVHEMIKDVVQSRFPKIGLESVLYGGSVNSKNAPSLFEQKNIDGALIGGASLDGKEFALIANVFNELRV
jgi:triosephosphate isomerase